MVGLVRLISSRANLNNRLSWVINKYKRMGEMIHSKYIGVTKIIAILMMDRDRLVRGVVLRG